MSPFVFDPILLSFPSTFDCFSYRRFFDRDLVCCEYGPFAPGLLERPFAHQPYLVLQPGSYSVHAILPYAPAAPAHVRIDIFIIDPWFNIVLTSFVKTNDVSLYARICGFTFSKKWCMRTTGAHAFKTILHRQNRGPDTSLIICLGEERYDM